MHKMSSKAVWGALPVLLLPLFAGMLLFFVSQISSHHQRVAALFGMEVETQRLLQIALDAETSGRGYLLTRDPLMLEPLRSLRAASPPQNVPVDLLPDEVVQRVDALRHLVAQRIIRVESYVARVQRGEVQSVAPSYLAFGRAIQDSIRAEARVVFDAIDRYLDEQREAQNRAVGVLVAVVVLATVGVVLLSIFWRRAAETNVTIRSDVERSYAAAIEDAEIGAAILDPRGVIRTVNASFLALAGLPQNKAVGARLGSVFPQLAVRLLRTPPDDTHQRPVSREEVIEHSVDGQIRHIRMSVPDFVAGDPMEHRLLLARDITAEVNDRAELRRHQELLDQAGDIAGFAAWSYDPAADEIRVGRAVAVLMGLPTMAAVPARRLKSVMSEDQFRNLIAVSRRCMEHGDSFELTLRTGAGTEQHDIHVTGQCRINGSGAVRLEGSAQDITHIREQYRAARRNEQMFRAIAAVTNDVIWQIDVASDRVDYLAAPGTTVPTHMFSDNAANFMLHVHPDDAPDVSSSFAEAMSGGKTSWWREFRYFDEQGKIRHAQSQAAFIRTEAGEVIDVVGGFQDRTEVRQMQSSMQEFATTATVAEGTEFFVQMLDALAKGIGADAVCIARIDPGGTTATTMGVHVDGVNQPDFTYEIAGSPCENLLTDTDCVISGGLQDLFAGAGRIGSLVADSYIGGRLSGPGGSVVGFLFALFRGPVKRTDAMNTLLQIFVARVEAEIQRLDTSRMLREQAELLDHAREAIMVCDLDGRIRFWNRGAEDLYRLSKSEAIGTHIARFYRHPDELDLAFREVTHSEQVVREFAQIVPADGSEIMVEESWTLIRSGDGAPDTVLKVGSDVTERHRAEARIRELAFFDPLTGLPNRRRFLEELDAARDAALSTGRHGALLFLDMDNFKTINDLHGHLVGDQLLIEVAQRLEGLRGPDDFVARLGGDEFVVILQDIGPDAAEAPQRATTFAERAVAELRRVVTLGDITLFSSVSIGITRYQDGTVKTKELLRQADVAMYSAKRAGRNTCVAYDPAVHDEDGEIANLTQDLRAAIGAGQMELCYQPQVDPLGRIYGVETLLRWHHPERGLVSPGDFIPLAERSGLIVDIGRWVIAQACRQIAEWNDIPQLAGLKVSVNVSVQQLKQKGFVSHVIGVLRDTGADPRRLMMEVTESVLEDNLARKATKLQELRALGIRISLDDFGTGYSSLSRLRKMPFDEIKIDQSFVRDIPENQRDCAIVTSIISLGTTMNMRVVAEGVESDRQLEFLRSQGCTGYQGFLFSHPLREADLRRFVTQGNRTAAAA